MRGWLSRRPADPPQVSILEHIRAHLRGTTVPLTAEGLRLPDEPAATAEEPRFAPGASEGISIEHSRMRRDEALADRIVGLIRPALGRPWGSPEVEALQEGIAGSDLLSAVWPLSERLLEGQRDGTVSTPGIHALGEMLASRAVRRESVKVGIVALVAAPTETDLDILRVLGRHDEFTWWVLMALIERGGDPASDLFRLAQGVRGWGRIHLVGVLIQVADDANVGDWLVRAGYRNTVSLGYTVLACATAGALADRLDAEPDDELLDSASEIVGGFMDSGHGPGLDAWPDSARAVQALFERSASRPVGVRRLALAARVLRGESERDGEPLLPWPEATQQAVRAAAGTLAARPDARAAVDAALASGDRAAFFAGVASADLVDVDPWGALLARSGPDMDLGIWLATVERTDDARTSALIDHAVRVLPLDAIGRGPGLIGPFGPGVGVLLILRSLLDRIATRPGEGWRVVRAAMRSPMPAVRLAAQQTLEAWGPRAWPAAVGPMLEEARENDPHEGVRDGASRLLRLR